MSKDLKLVPLFGDNNDMRAKLFIDQLRDSADAVRAGGSYVNVRYNRSGNIIQKFGNVQITEVTKGLQNRFFTQPAPTRGDMDVHPEWEEFMCDLHARIQENPYLLMPKMSLNNLQVLLILVLKKNLPKLLSKVWYLHLLVLKLLMHQLGVVLLAVVI